MTQLLEVFPYLLFAITYFVFKQDLLVCTQILLIATVLCAVGLWFKEKKLTPMQWIMLVVTVVFCAITLYFRNAEIIKWKPTLINGAFGLALLGGHFFLKKTPFEYMLGNKIELPALAWRHLNIAWACFFLFCGLLNAYLVMTHVSDGTWTFFKAVISPIMTFVFVIFQTIYLVKVMKGQDINSILPKQKEE